MSRTPHHMESRCLTRPKMEHPRRTFCLPSTGVCPVNAVISLLATTPSIPLLSPTPLPRPPLSRHVYIPPPHTLTPVTVSPAASTVRFQAKRSSLCSRMAPLASHWPTNRMTGCHLALLGHCAPTPWTAPRHAPLTLQLLWCRCVCVSHQCLPCQPGAAATHPVRLPAPPQPPSTHPAVDNTTDVCVHMYPHLSPNLTPILTPTHQSPAE
jgi:hypothetical protein